MYLDDGVADLCVHRADETRSPGLMVGRPFPFPFPFWGLPKNHSRRHWSSAGSPYSDFNHNLRLSSRASTRSCSTRGHADSLSKSAEAGDDVLVRFRASANSFSRSFTPTSRLGHVLMTCRTSSIWVVPSSTPSSRLAAFELPSPAPVRFAEPRKPRLPTMKVLAWLTGRGCA